MYGRFARLIVDHVRAATLLSIVLVVGMSLGMFWLRVDFSVKSFFGSNDPDAEYLAEYEKRWNAADPLIVVVDGGGKSLLARDRLQHIDELAKAIAAVEGVAAVTSPTTMPVEGDRIGIRYIPKPLLATVPKVDAPPERVEAWQKRITSDDRLVPSLLSADGEWAALIVQLGVDLDDLVVLRPVVHAVERVALAAEVGDGVVYRVAGVPAIRAHVLEVMVRDQAILIPIAGVLILALLGFLFRSFRGIAVPTVIALAPTTMLFGWMGYRGEPLGLLTQLFIVLIPAMAFAMAIHLLARYREEILHLGSEEPTPEQRRDAIVATMQALGTACFLTTFTTVVGFWACNITNMQVLKSFGNYAALGVTISWAMALLLMPVALWYHRHRDVPAPTGLYGFLSRGLHSIALQSVRNPWPVVLGTVVVLALAILASLRVTVDYSLTSVYGPKNPVTIANQQIDEHLGGVLGLEIDLAAPPGALEDPAVLAALEQVEAELQSRPEVRQAYGLASYLGFMSTLMGGPDKVPGDADLVRRVYKFAESVPGLDQFVSADCDHTRIVVRTVDLGAAEFDTFSIELAADIESRLATHGIDAHPTGPSLLAYRGLAQVAGDLTSSLVLAAAIIAALIAVMFRSLGLGLLSLVPNLVPLAIGYGLLGVLGVSLDPAPAVVFAVSLGLAVDSTIHVMARFLEHRSEGLPTAAAISGAVEHSGQAVIVTGTILVVGFGVNAFSSFPANTTFGWLGAFILLVGLLSNLVLLPALMSLVYGGRTEAQAGVSSVPVPERRGRQA